MEAFNENMITLQNNDNLEIISQNEIQNYFIINENFLDYIISNMFANNLLILFIFACFSSIYCCEIKNRNNKYHYQVVEENEPIIGEIVLKDEKV